MAKTSEPITVSATLLSQMFLYLESLQVDVDTFLYSLGVEPARVKSPDAPVPIETYLLIQDEAAVFVNDSYFGLHMGEFAKAGSWSILGYMMMNCKDVGEAFEKSVRYARIIGNLIEARLERKSTKSKITFFTAPHAPEMSRHCFDTIFSSSVRMMRNFTGVNIQPLDVTFSYPEPKARSEYERIFHCPLLFDQKENSFTIDTSILDTPILMANPGLLEYFEKYAQDFLAEMESQNEYTRIVTRIILACLDDEALSIEKVAREMAISVRTLQKRLEEEGVIFSDLLKDVRQRLAQKYLRENYSVEQITYLLGFSEPSVFRKAFKKWSGVTPREYREQSFSA
jgi:AraC-like DNA-binding protein